VATLVHGNRDGEEGGDSEDGEAEKVAAVDEGRHPDVKDARARKDKDMIARKLKRSVNATRHKASVLGVTLGGGRGRKRA
jgi:hypothetical protein